ncbi:F-box protein [Arachis hypogaea]|nr:F-box protein [Arachis hypogaea]
MNCVKLNNLSRDKKERLKHTMNKAKQQSTMEKKMKQQQQKQKSIHDILHLELIHSILLRVPVKHLARLRCVSKPWYSLISDPQFAELHLHHSPVSLPFKKKPPSEFRVMGSCREFVLLSRQPHFFVVWNPLTGFSKRISYSCIVPPSSNKRRYFIKFLRKASLYGFGYDASRDDYLVVVAWQDGDCQHLDCLSLRTNSWINLDAALPKRFGFMK